MAGITLIVLLLLLLILSVPIFVSIGFATLLVLFFTTDTPPTLIVQRYFSGVDSFALMAMPFFIFASYIMDVGGISRRILDWAKVLIGHVSGGLAMTTQVASMLFGSLSGSSPATVAAIGRAMYPELIKGGYDKSFASGLITSSGSVALLIPPGLTMIIYATVVGESVGKMFIAGIGAGLFYGIAFLAYIYYYARKNNLPRTKRAPFSSLLKETRRAAWSLAVPFIILGGIFLGVFTTTESAGVAVAYSMLVGIFIYKEITIRKLYKASVDSAILSAQVLILVASASGLAWLLTSLMIPQTISELINNTVSSGWALIILLNIFLLIVGMFIDGITAIIIVAPLIFVSAMSFDIDPIHLGIIMVANLAIGNFTPPFGLNIFVAQGITKLSIVELLPGVFKFLIVSIVALLILSYIPQITMFLPDLLYK